MVVAIIFFCFSKSQIWDPTLETIKTKKKPVLAVAVHHLQDFCDNTQHELREQTIS